MEVFNLRVSKKVYLITFYENKKVVHRFAFSIPPQSEEFIQNQRINETKTFGGAVFEDYGNDTLQINLSGTTVNNELRVLEKTNNIVSGPDEIFMLSNTIKLWGQHDKIYKKSISLIDLSTGNTWEDVLIKDFNYKRSKENPFAYFYTISFITSPSNLRYKSQTRLKTPSRGYEQRLDNDISKLNVLSSKFSKLKEEISLAKNKIEKIFKPNFEKVKEIINYLDTLTNEINQVSKLISDTIGVFSGILIDVTSASFDLLKSIYGTTESVGTFLFNPIQRIFSDWREAFSIFKRNYPFLKSAFLEGGIVDLQYLNADVINEYNNLIQDIQDTLNISLYNIDNDVCEVSKEVKSLPQQLNVVVKIGQNGESDELIRVYGELETTVKDSTTYDYLADQYYGDASLGSIIASYNSNTEFKLGNKIKIPILNESDLFINNEIYANPNNRDNYGVDISIKNGDINFSDNDIALVYGVDNVNQAINNRLSSQMEERVRQPYYGLVKFVGNSTESLTFLNNSIKTTVSEDPRVLSIDNLKIKGMGDNLQIKLTYTDINKNTNEFMEVL
jgi:hypothetical protein